MKFVWILAVPALLVALAVGGRMQSSPPMTQVFNEAKQWAVPTLELTTEPCSSFGSQGKSTVACFGTHLSDEEFMQRVRAERRLSSITGWRDDYGVLGGAFEFAGVRAYEVGLIYRRLTSADDIDANAARAYKKGYAALVTLVIDKHR